MLCYAALLALVASAVPALAVPALSLDVASSKAVDGVDNLSLKLTLTNSGNDTVKLLKDPRSTLSTFPTDSFKIVNDESGKSPVFSGIAVKYAPEDAAKFGEEDAFTVLEPGKSVTVDHKLSDAYDFSSSGAGSYTIEPSTRLYYVDEDGSPVEVHAAAKKTQVSLSGTLSPTSPADGEHNLEARATYRGCSAARVAAIGSARTWARTYTRNAITKLNAGNSRRFRTWFGTYTSARRNTVRSHFNAINRSGFDGFRYDCTCTDSGVYAYVYPNQYGTIYLCGAFWRAPVRGTDSKAGTLIHESSHFTRHGGTRDYAYGQAAAKRLAISNPARAIMNADSHEYFAENTPNIA